MEFSRVWLILSIETLVLVCGQKGKIAPAYYYEVLLK